MAYIRLKTTTIWLDATKLILRETFLDSRFQKTNLIYISLNVLIVRVTTKQTVTTVLSRSMDSIMIDIIRSLKSLEKSKLTQFAQVQVGQSNDFAQLKNLFIECSQEPTPHEPHP